MHALEFDRLMALLIGVFSMSATITRPSLVSKPKLICSLCLVLQENTVEIVSH